MAVRELDARSSTRLHLVKNSTPSVHESLEFMNIHQRWLRLVRWLINELLYTQTTDEVHEDVIRAVKSGFSTFIGLLKFIPVGKSAFYETQYGTILRIFDLLVNYKPKFQREELIHLRQELERYLNSKP